MFPLFKSTPCCFQRALLQIHCYSALHVSGARKREAGCRCRCFSGAADLPRQGICDQLSGIMVFTGKSSPFMALIQVNYYNLPRYQGLSLEASTLHGIDVVDLRIYLLLCLFTPIPSELYSKLCWFVILGVMSDTTKSSNLMICCGSSYLYTIYIYHI